MQLSKSIRKIRLSIHATCVAAVNGVNWADEIIDAAIVAGITFFAGLGGMAAVDVPTVKAFVAAGIAAGAQFFTVLGLKRGLVKKE